MIFITGGAGFIGSNFITHWFSNKNEPILNIDKLTYAGNLANLSKLKDNNSYHFVQADIADIRTIEDLLSTYKPRAVINFAAETHVDRSILDPDQFIHTNIYGTFRLLQAVKSYWLNLKNLKQQEFRFLHISTDEVYGSIPTIDGPEFSEDTAYAPNSPYSASKAGSDHFVRAYYQTYNLPCITSNCSNNYGPYQYPEKFVPLIILNALQELPIPIYGDGLNIRDWLYVIDHCDAINLLLEKGKVGETYNIGGDTQLTNLDLAKIICKLLDELKPTKYSYAELITFVNDRAGHDFRYAVNTNKIKTELGWCHKESFETGITKTIRWYLNNMNWIDEINTKHYQQWISQNYNQR